MARLDLGVMAVGAAVVAGLLGAAAWVYWPTGGDPFAHCQTSRVAGALGGPFTLVDSAGRTVTDKDVITGPTLLYFGYTYCPDVCPLDAARNQEAQELLAERGRTIASVFVSVDPERDTPEVMAEFSGYFPGELRGLTGSPEQVAEAAKAYRVFYRKQDGDPEHYLVSHTVFTYLAFPQHGVVEYFNRDISADAMADRLECFLKAA